MSQTTDSQDDIQQDYFCILTDSGAALEAAAHAKGLPLYLTHVAVGDGNGEVPVPSQKCTALVHEVYRRPIDGRRQDEDDPNVAWIHIVIPADVGGFWIREFAIYAQPIGVENPEEAEPVLYAVGNHAPYYKTEKILGQATTHELQIPVILSGTANVQISVKDAGYASQSSLNATNAIVANLVKLGHSHANKPVLDQLTENEAGQLTYKNQPINDGKLWVAAAADIASAPENLAEGGLLIINPGLAPVPDEAEEEEGE